MKSKMFKNPTGFVYGSGNLVQFRAGRMNMVGNMVHADTRKGLVYVRKGDDGLLHFCWKDRETDKIEDDLILFPEDFEFKRVDKCNTGRVYVMIFKASTRRLFYWMQEVKSSKDEEYCTRINELINNPPTASQQRVTSAFTNSLFDNMTHQQIINLLTDVTQRKSSTSITSSDVMKAKKTSASATPLNTNDNAKALPEAANSGTSKGAAPVLVEKNVVATSSKKKTNPKTKKSAGESLQVNLTEALNGFTNSKAFLDIISNDEHVYKLAMLLPKSEDDNEDRRQLITDTMSTPELQTSLSEFCSAFPSKILGTVLSSLELPAEAVVAASSGNLETFLRALEDNGNADVNMSGVEEDKENINHNDKRKREPEPDKKDCKRK